MQFAKQADDQKPKLSNFDKLVELLRYEPLNQLNKVKLTNIAVAQGFHNVDIDDLFRELVRLNQSCNQTLDLRWKIKGVEINEVKIFDKVHFIDPWTAKFLVEEIKKYQKKYTLGAYERTRQFFNSNKRSLQSNQKALDTEIKIVSLCDEFVRGEERMHFAKTVSVCPLSIQTNQRDYVPKESDILGTCQATTSNISKSGLKIKTSTNLEDTQYIVVRFDSLEQELVFTQSDIVYKVIKGFYDEQSRSYEYILGLQDNVINEEFSHYLQNLIYSHKYQYKVDLDNIVESAFSKGCEKHINNINSVLDCFLDNRGKLEYILRHPDNIRPIHYFEGNLQKIATSLLKFSLPDKNSVFSFLFCATGTVSNSAQESKTKMVVEIFDSKQSDRFFKVVNRFKSAKTALLFKVTSSKIDQDTAFRNSSIPEESQELYGSLRINRHSKLTRENVKKLMYHISFEPLHIDSLQYLLDKTGSKNKVQPTIFPINDPAPQGYKIIEKENDEKRLEDRFNYTTQVSFQHNGETISGNTINVSSLGLAVEVSRTLSLIPNSNITVSFPQLARRTTMFDLSRCIYEVVGCKDGLLRLNSKNFSVHDARNFWLKFVLAKLDQIQATGRENENYGLCRALANIAINNWQQNVLFYKLLNKKPLATAYVENSLDLTPENKTTIGKLVRYWFYQSDIYDQLKAVANQVNARQEQQHFLLILNRHQSLNGFVIEGAALIATDDNTPSKPEALDIKLINSQQQYVYKLTFHKTGSNFSRYNIDEINYVKRYYPHKSEELQLNLNEINGILTLTDVSDLFKSA